MIRFLRAKSLNVITPLLFLGVSIPMALYYYRFDEKNLKVVSRTRSKFYEQLNPRWLQPSVAEMATELRTDTLSGLNQIILRAAMSRWRVQEKSPHAFERLTRDYSRGWWNDAFVSDLKPMLEEMDKRWIEARKRAERQGGIVMPTAKKVEGAGFGLEIPAGIKTPRIGSLIEVVVEAGRVTDPQESVQAYWITKQHPDVMTSRSKLCTYDNTGQTSGGLPLYRIIMDMADSPEWLYPETEPIYIHYRGSGKVDWTPVAFKLRDSPSLMVNNRD